MMIGPLAGRLGLQFNRQLSIYYQSLVSVALFLGDNAGKAGFTDYNSFLLNGTFLDAVDFGLGPWGHRSITSASLRATGAARAPRTGTSRWAATVASPGTSPCEAVLRAGAASRSAPICTSSPSRERLSCPLRSAPAGSGIDPKAFIAFVAMTFGTSIA